MPWHPEARVADGVTRTRHPRHPALPRRLSPENLAIAVPWTRRPWGPVLQTAGASAVTSSRGPLRQFGHVSGMIKMGCSRLKAGAI
jgi:hypothetical protein